MMTYLRSVALLFASAALVLSSVASASAWSSGGHRVIANIAYDLLDPAIRTEVVAAIKSHPRFEHDFAKRMPENVSKDQQERWLFLQASTWPDLARKTEFDHPQWHYINAPFFLGEVDQDALKNVPGIFPRQDLPNGLVGDPKGLNAVQALTLCVQRLQAPGTEAQKKAVYLCWLMHLIGDLHQPLHTTALYSRGRFHKKGGDHGGNAIPVKQSGNLHALWDGLLGKNVTLNEVRKRAQEITSDADLKKAGEDAARSLKFEDWVQEGVAICKSDVYAKSILDAVVQSDAAPARKLAVMDLPTDYLKTAGKIARRRAVQAGYRLTALLKQCAQVQNK